MQRRTLLIAAAATILAIVAVTVASAAGQTDVRRLRGATARFKRTAAAEAAGYTLVAGLDHCFDQPGVGGMGVHYIHTASLDATVDMLKPEAMVYYPNAEGELRLGAVEYIVPAEAWEAEGHAALPSLFDQTFHLNEALGVYVLHAWIWKENPAGLFEDWNPEVSCAGIGGPS